MFLSTRRAQHEEHCGPLVTLFREPYVGGDLPRDFIFGRSAALSFGYVKCAGVSASGTPAKRSAPAFDGPNHLKRFGRFTRRRRERLATALNNATSGTTNQKR